MLSKFLKEMYTYYLSYDVFNAVEKYIICYLIVNLFK